MGTTKFDMFKRAANSGKISANTAGYTLLDYSGSGLGKHYAGFTHVYYFDGSNVDTIGIMTSHRAKVCLRMLRNGNWFNINPDIRANYVTNGFNTRCGIEKASKKLARITIIAKSHKENSFSGNSAHEQRVRVRN
jgi:hypothetical protein